MTSEKIVEQLKQRIETLESASQQNIMNHHALLGRIAESKEQLKSIEESLSNNELPESDEIISE